MNEKHGDSMKALEQALTRRRFLMGGAAGAAAVVGLGLPGIAGVAAAEGERALAIKVEDAQVTLLEATNPNYFVVVGNVTTVDGQAASGKFFCRGVLFLTSTLDAGTPDPGAGSHVDQRFKIDGRGTILGAGAEFDPDEPLVIVGGTGDFVGVSGTYMGLSGNPIPFDDGKLVFLFRIRGLDGQAPSSTAAPAGTMS